jgi:hypothetical protein
MTSAVAVADGVAMRARDRAESAAAVRPRAWVATAAIAAIALAIFLAFVGYGFQLEDEGTVLYQILRTYRGERPYIDFHTGYTPAMFYLNAGLFRLFGVSVVPVRIVLALVNALAAALTFRLALRLAPPLEAAFAALAYAFCMPFFAGQFASFNIPYPAWYAVAAWLGAELASMRAVEGGGRRWLAVVGVLAGIAFSFKPNTGVLCLGAAALGQLLATPPIAGRIGVLVESAVLAIACAAVAAVLAFEVFSVKFALLGLPLAVLLASAIVVRVRRGSRRNACARSARRSATLSACLRASSRSMWRGSPTCSPTSGSPASAVRCCSSAQASSGSTPSCTPSPRCGRSSRSRSRSARRSSRPRSNAAGLRAAGSP